MTDISTEKVGRASPRADEISDEDRLAGTLAPPVNASGKMRLRTMLAIPIATSAAFTIHYFVSGNQPVTETKLYLILLSAVFSCGVLAGALQLVWKSPRRWLGHICPIIAATFLLLAVWDLITTGFHLLPLPYFPGPAA